MSTLDKAVLMAQAASEEDTLLLDAFQQLRYTKRTSEVPLVWSKVAPGDLLLSRVGTVYKALCLVEGKEPTILCKVYGGFTSGSKNKPFKGSQVPLSSLDFRFNTYYPCSPQEALVALAGDRVSRRLERAAETLVREAKAKELQEMKKYRPVHKPRSKASWFLKSN